jgi:hypothetical protein
MRSATDPPVIGSIDGASLFLLARATRPVMTFPMPAISSIRSFTEPPQRSRLRRLIFHRPSKVEGRKFGIGHMTRDENHPSSTAIALDDTIV